MKKSVTTSYQHNNNSTGICCWDGCGEEAKFPAPKSPDNPDRFYFCLAHIREYNKSWNFFCKSGMDMQQIDKFQRDTLVGHRPTWKFGVDGINFNTIEEIQTQVFGKFRGNPKAPSKKHEVILPKQAYEALKILGLSYPVTLQHIKKIYKKLAKEHHPDLNDHTSDEKIKKINQAYSYLKSLSIFN